MSPSLNSGLVDRVYGPATAGVARSSAADFTTWVRGQHLAPIAIGWIALLLGTIALGGPRLVGQAAAATYLLVALYGLHLLTVETGQPSLGHAAFLAVGAYLTVALRVGLGLDGLVSAAVAGVGSGLVGLGLAYGMARLGPATLALATWAFGWLLFVTAAAYPAIGGGGSGISLGLPIRLQVAVLGVDITFREPQHLLLGSALLALVLLLLRSAQRSSIGLVWAALRDSRSLPRALGFDVASTRRWAFFVSAALAGLAGSLGAQLVGVVDPTTFTPVTSLLLFAAVLVGAPLGFAGPLVGLAVTVGVPALVDLVGGATGIPVNRVGGVLTAVAVILGLVLSVRALGRPEAGAATSRTAAGAMPAAGARPRRPRRRPTAVVLEVIGIHKGYGGVAALAGVSLAVGPGEIRGLMGPNGSGKSTLLRCISGTITADAGSVRVGDLNVTARDEVERSRAGILRTFQRTIALGGLTAAQHVELGLLRHTRGGWLAALLKTPRYRARAVERQRSAGEILALFGIVDGSAHPGVLPSGRQRLLQVAAAAAAQPAILLLDEPSAGMSSEEAAALESGLHAVAAQGVAIIVVEHDVALLRRVCDRITVLSEGRELITGTPLQVTRNRQVRAVYLGSGAR